MNIQCLPDEILEKIFLKLSPYKDFDVVSQVCIRWNAVIARTIKTYQRNCHDAFETGNIMWKELSINTDKSTMSPRLLQSVSYNDHARSIYIFGGRSIGPRSAGFNDLWRMDMYNMRWERQIANGDFPQPKFGCSLESYRSYLILFGGQSVPVSAPFSLQLQEQGSDDLHVFDVDSTKWTIKPTVDAAPPPLYLHGTCVVTNEGADDCMVMFGGISMQTDSNALWCLDLPELNWWRPTVLGEVPPARYLHSQTSYKNKQMFSSAVLIVGGVTSENQILSDAWTLIRSGYREWTSSRIEIESGPMPPLSVFKRKAIKVGDNLIFFGSAPLNKSYIRKNVRTIDECWDTKTANCEGISDKEHCNPMFTYILDVRNIITKCIARWTGPYMTTGAVPNKFLGPNKPNYHIAVVCRGHVIIHGDFAVDNPHFAERTDRARHNVGAGATNKWPLFYLVTPAIS